MQWSIFDSSIPIGLKNVEYITLSQTPQLEGCYGGEVQSSRMGRIGLVIISPFLLLLDNEYLTHAMQMTLHCKHENNWTRSMFSLVQARFDLKKR